jgi:uncharacterized protein (TIGR03437 family)
MRLLTAAILSLAATCCAFGQTYTINTFAGGALPLNVPGTSGSLDNPGSVAVDRSGNLFFAERNNIVLRLDAMTGTLTLVAGNGTPGYSGDNGQATNAQLNEPAGVAFDAAGNLYIAEFGNNCIRRVSNGLITTIAGNGTGGYSGDNGPATSARLDGPVGVAIDTAGNLYIADTNNQRIRKVSNGVITTVAGNGTAGFNGDSGAAISAQLNYPQGVAVDSSGNMYISDGRNERIRKVSNGVITTVAGNGTPGYSGDNGQATGAQLFLPFAVAVDLAGNLYISDYGNDCVRRVSNGVISTVVRGGGLVSVHGIAVDPAGNLYIADSEGNRIWKTSNGLMTTLAGNGTYDFGGDNGPATNAQAGTPSSVAVDAAGNLYFADPNNNRIRKIANGIITTVAGNGTSYTSVVGDNGPATSAELSDPGGIAVDAAGNLYIADPGDGLIRKVSNGVITTVAGGGGQGFGGDHGPATGAELNDPTSVAVDTAGNLYIADSNNNRIRKVSNGVITTFAGNGTPGFSGDNGPAANAQLNGPGGIAVDAAGNLYIADGLNYRIRKVSNGVITTVAGNGNLGFSGDNGPATSASLGIPSDVTVDSSGSLYIADTRAFRVLKVSNGVISTVAGNGTDGFSGDNGPATTAQLSYPTGVAVDASGDVFIADSNNDRIRILTPSKAPTITTSSMPTGTLGTAYTQTLSANGGIPPYHNWVLSSGALPPWLTLDADSGVISGVPYSALGSPFAFSVTVQDSTGNVSPARNLAISVSQPPALTIITSSPLPSGGVQVPCNQVFAATSGTAPYRSWAVTAGSLPPGTALGGTLVGTLTGTPTTAGTFAFTVQVTDGVNATATKQFSLTVNPAGTVTISLNGIVNSASYIGGGVAPGEIVTIFGSGLGPNTLATEQVNSNGNVAPTLAGAEVMFDGVAAPLVYAEADQASAVVPYEVSGKTSTQVQVLYQGQPSSTLTVPVVSATPGVFTLDYSGSGAGVILNQDGTVNSPNNPAPVGSLITVFATGEGQTNPPGVDGKLDGSPAPQPVQAVAATIGGTNAKVQYASGIPGAVPGVLQVTLQVPTTLTSGNAVPVVLNIGGATSQADVTLAVTSSTGPQTLATTSVSTSSPEPLTPLYISTTGLNVNAPVTIQFSNSAGFSWTQQSLRVGSDGTVVAATPLYVDPATHTTGPGTVSMVLTQGGQSTAPVSIAIQDLPSLSSYGTQLGQISHAFFVYEAMLIARRINEFQAYQALPGNKVDTTQAQASLQTLLKGIIQARNDVDYVSLNNGLVIPGGALSNGFAIQFDQNSLDLMDRIIAVHLSQIASMVSSAPKPLVSASVKVKGIRPVFRLPRLTVPSGHASAATSSPGGPLGAVIIAIESAKNEIGLAQATSDYYANDATAIDKGLALSGGLQSLYSQMTLGSSGPANLFGEVYGAVIGSATLLNNLGMELGDLGFLMYASRYGGDQSVIADATNDLNNRASASADALIDTELNLVKIGGELGSFGPEWTAVLQSDAGTAALDSVDFIHAAAQCADSSCYASLEDTSLQVAAETTTSFSSDTQGFAIVDGGLNISNSFGLAADQDEVQLSSSGIAFNALADESGNYLMFVPLQEGPFDYAAADLQIIDPTSQNIVDTIDLTNGATDSSQVINLSALSTEAPFGPPSITVALDCNALFNAGLNQCYAVWGTLSTTVNLFGLSYCTELNFDADIACMSSKYGIAGLPAGAGNSSPRGSMSRPPNASCSPRTARGTLSPPNYSKLGVQRACVVRPDASR